MKGIYGHKGYIQGVGDTELRGQPIYYGGDARETHPCPKGDSCALNDGARTCLACGRNWPPDETVEAALNRAIALADEWSALERKREVGHKLAIISSNCEDAKEGVLALIERCSDLGKRNYKLTQANIELAELVDALTQELAGLETNSERLK